MPKQEPLEAKPLTGKQLWVAVLAAVGFFGYLALTMIFSGNPTVRMILIGPYGISAAVWLGSALAILGWLTGREKRRLNR